MRVLLVGSLASGALERYCARGLEALGHELLVYDRHVELNSKVRFQNTPVLYELEQIPLRRCFNKRLLKVAEGFQPELVIIVKGVEILPETIKSLRKLAFRPILVNWNPDSPFDYATANTNKNIIDSIPLFDIYFIWDKDLFAPLQNAGTQQVEYLPFAYDPEAHAPATLSVAERDMLQSEVCFVGGYTPERAALLEHLTTFDLRVFGTNWEKVAANNPLRGCIVNEWRGERALAKVVAGSTLTLNFIRKQNGQAHNMRTFEAPAMGGCMLSTLTRDQQKWLPDDVGAVYFTDADSLQEQVRYYVKHTDEAAQIAAEGHRLITEGKHTYKDRMQHLIEAVEVL